MSSLMIIVLAIEAHLDMELKVWQQAVLGTEFYFRPLVVLIKYFKSYMIDFCRCGVKYLFDSRIDPGGQSNMLKLFDDIWRTMWHIYPVDIIGLYDAEGRKRHHWLIKDRPEMITTDTDPLKEVRQAGEEVVYLTRLLVRLYDDYLGNEPPSKPPVLTLDIIRKLISVITGDEDAMTNVSDIQNITDKLEAALLEYVEATKSISDTVWSKTTVKRQPWMGSLRLVDEAKFYLNGADVDAGTDGRGAPQFWLTGEEDVGRFDVSTDRHDQMYDHVLAHQPIPVDEEGWKEFVESYVPPEETE
jgi:hypothetical protein